MPDISLVVPLAKTLRVSTDSLFGINEEKYDSQIYINLKRNIEKIEADAEATTEPVGETSNPRGFDTRRGNKITKEVSIGYLLKNKSARRGSNPRPPPWQGGAPPLSHSRKSYVHVTRKK